MANDLDYDQRFPSRKRPSRAMGFSSGQPDTVSPSKPDQPEIVYRTFASALTSRGGKVLLGRNVNRKFLLISNTTNSLPIGRSCAISFGANIFGNMETLETSSVQPLGAYILSPSAELKIENHAATNEVYAIAIATACSGYIDNLVISITEGTQIG